MIVILIYIKYILANIYFPLFYLLVGVLCCCFVGVFFMKNCEVVLSKGVKFINYSSKEDTYLQKYLREIAKIPILSAEEERNLAKKIKNGDIEAKKLLIKSNLKLAANIAAKIKKSNMTFSDLLQEANIGLMVAVDKYNYKLGYRFSTYASWWIKQAVLKAISEQSGCMKVPVYVQEIVSKYSKMKSLYENELQMNLSVKDMASKMKIDAQKLEEYVNAFQCSSSLDEKVFDDNSKETTLMDMIADENINVTAKAEYEAIKDAVNKAMEVLKEREQKVVIFRFGLNENEKKTLDEIGKMFGITKECVRQTEIRAIKHLKEFFYAKDKDFCYCQ